MAAPGTAGRSTQWPEHIRARYGVTRRPRWVAPLLLVIGLLAVGVAATFVWQLANPAVAAGIVSYRTVADDHTIIDFQVQRTRATEVTCVLRTRADDGYDVGYAVVTVPAGQGRTEHSFDMRTAYRGFVGELLGCAADGPPEGVAPAQFRPGVVPPEQPWTSATS